jgi:hypothetical protein
MLGQQRVNTISSGIRQVAERALALQKGVPTQWPAYSLEPIFLFASDNALAHSLFVLYLLQESFLGHPLQASIFMQMGIYSLA